MVKVAEGICIAAGGRISGPTSCGGSSGAAAVVEEGGGRSLGGGVVQVLAEGMRRDICSETAIGLRRTQR